MPALEQSSPTESLDHAELRWLIARVRTASREAVASLLFDEFADALDAHLRLIDRILLPSLRGTGGDGGALQYIDSHWYLRRSLADLRTMERHGDPFAKRLAAVCNRLERQLMREATDLLPRLGDLPAGGHAGARAAA